MSYEPSGVTRGGVLLTEKMPVMLCQALLVIRLCQALLVILSGSVVPLQSTTFRSSRFAIPSPVKNQLSIYISCLCTIIRYQGYQGKVSRGNTKSFDFLAVLGSV